MGKQHYSVEKSITTECKQVIIRDDRTSQAIIISGFTTRSLLDLAINVIKLKTVNRPVILARGTLTYDDCSAIMGLLPYVYVRDHNDPNSTNLKLCKSSRIRSNICLYCSGWQDHQIHSQERTAYECLQRYFNSFPYILIIKS